MTLDHADARYALEAKGLTVVLGGHQVLNVPSLQMNPNETLVIIGPNGSGKTTFLLCLAMLLEPEEGVVLNMFCIPHWYSPVKNDAFFRL